MKIHAIIFTYEGDRELSAIAAAALLKAGCVVTLAWDRNAPQWALEKTPGANHVVTDFNRGRNLNGPECVRGMAAAFEYVNAGADWVVKVDSDTIVRPGFFARLAASTKDAEGFYCVSANKRPWWGACYAIRGKHIPKLRQALDAKQDLAEKCPEDWTMCEMLVALKLSTNCGALEWHSHDIKGKQVITDAGSEGAHYGDLRNIPAPHFTVLQRKKYVAKLMAQDPVFST